MGSNAMGTMTCVKCKDSWYEKGFSINTICEDCKDTVQVEEEVETASSDFKEIVCEMLMEEEVEMLKNVDWEELMLLGAEHVTSQLRWKLLKIRKGSV
jgi:tRNA A37 threonylcarbamoyltransferase TsaD